MAVAAAVRQWSFTNYEEKNDEDNYHAGHKLEIKSELRPPRKQHINQEATESLKKSLATCKKCKTGTHKEAQTHSR